MTNSGTGAMKIQDERGASFSAKQQEVRKKQKNKGRSKSTGANLKENHMA